MNRVVRLCCAAIAAIASSAMAAEPIQPLKVQGADFVDPMGKAVRFWGVNLVSFYPDHSTADATAAHLASLQVNLARPHHNLRASKDWNPTMTSGALVTYAGNSRTFDLDALDRFDYLNAALKRNGIYLALSIHSSRVYRPGDADILKTTDDDAKAWSAAIDELNSWDWKKGIDPKKCLPVIDERAALLTEEFARNLLTHLNPYTQTTYAADPQVLTLEVINEASTEYAVICGNKFPDYWQQKLLARWAEFAGQNGVEAGDLYSPKTPEQVRVRAAFFRKLDGDYFERIKRAVRATGSNAAMTFSNLWRGENALAMHEQQADFIENHAYSNPLVAGEMSDMVYDVSRSRLADKPFFIGELNQAEGSKNIEAQSPTRTMLPLATAAYGSLQNWTGVVWFAWQHGAKAAIGLDGRAVTEGRVSDIGQMITDGQMIDHLRTAGLMFRQGLIAPSVSPVTVTIDEPLAAKSYHDLMDGKTYVRKGWQNIHAISKRFGQASAEQKTASWMTAEPTNPLVSDTKQIVKDVARRQLTVAAPKAEAFSGFLDGKDVAATKTLKVEGSEGFATVIVVAADDQPLADSGHLIVSRTSLDAANAETHGPAIRLSGLRANDAGKQWKLRITRPAEASSVANQGVQALSSEGGTLQLGVGAWHECELVYE